MTGWSWCAWLDAVEAAAIADTSPDRPALPAIHTIATMRARDADYRTGGNCFPARATLAKRAGVKRTTVAAVDTWLVAAGLMHLVRKRAGNVDEYQLTTPDDATTDRPVDPPEEQPAPVDNPPVDPSGAQPPLTPEGINRAPVVPPVDPLLVPLEAHDLLSGDPSTRRLQSGETGRDPTPDDDDLQQPATDPRVLAAAAELGRRDHERALADGVPVGHRHRHRQACIDAWAADTSLADMAAAQPDAGVDELVAALDPTARARDPVPGHHLPPPTDPAAYEHTTTDRGAPAVIRRTA